MGEATNKTTRVARKTHICHLCQDPILPGTEYVRWAWFDGGSAAAVKCHPDCDQLWDFASEGDDEMSEGALVQALRWATLAEVEAEIGGPVTERIRALWQGAHEGQLRVVQ